MHSFQNLSYEDFHGSIAIIPQLITENKFLDAIGLIKPMLESKISSITKQGLIFLDQLITTSVEQGNLTFAANLAAVYRANWKGDYPISEAASWNNILHKIFEQGDFPKLDIPTQFLKPQHVIAPFVLDKIACKIWKLFEEQNWQIPGFEVTFDAYGHPKEILLYRVSEIRGEDFIIGFLGRQARIGTQYDIGGFNFIAINNLAMEYFEDGSGPNVWQYAGNDWKKQINEMTCYSSFNYKSGWRQVNVHVPEMIFFSLVNLKEIEERKKIACELLSKAVDHLNNVILPRLQASISQNKNLDVTRYNSNSMTRR